MTDEQILELPEVRQLLSCLALEGRGVFEAHVARAFRLGVEMAPEVRWPRSGALVPASTFFGTLPVYLMGSESDEVPCMRVVGFSPGGMWVHDGRVYDELDLVLEAMYEAGAGAEEVDAAIASGVPCVWAEWELL